MDYEVVSFTPTVPSVRFDIMVGRQWRGQISFTMTPGLEYAYDELKAMARISRPSLAYKDFELVPTEQRVT